MNIFDWQLAPGFERLLARRAHELHAVLGTRDALVVDAGIAVEVDDFKDIATRDSLATVSAAQVERAAQELQQVLAARARLRDRSFGECLDCGEPIPLARLSAIPHSAYCTDCQSVHEQVEAALPRH